VNEALARRVTPPATARKRQVTELAEARTELENITNAIRQGILTLTTKQMLEEAEQRVAHLEAALKAPATKGGNVSALPWWGATSKTCVAPSDATLNGHGNC